MQTFANRSTQREFYYVVCFCQNNSRSSISSSSKALRNKNLQTWPVKSGSIPYLLNGVHTVLGRSHKSSPKLRPITEKPLNMVWELPDTLYHVQLANLETEDCGEEQLFDNYRNVKERSGLIAAPGGGYRASAERTEPNNRLRVLYYCTVSM